MRFLKTSTVFLTRRKRVGSKRASVVVIRPSIALLSRRMLGLLQCLETTIACLLFAKQSRHVVQGNNQSPPSIESLHSTFIRGGSSSLDFLVHVRRPGAIAAALSAARAQILPIKQRLAADRSSTALAQYVDLELVPLDGEGTFDVR